MREIVKDLIGYLSFVKIKEEDKLVATHYDMYAQIDYDAVMVEMKQEELQAGIDEKLNYMADIMKKYDV